MCDIVENGAKYGSNCSAHVALLFEKNFANSIIPVFFIVLKTSHVFLFIDKIKFTRARDAQVGTFVRCPVVSS